MSTQRIILVTGGARAGKSRLAEELATHLGGDDVAFVATAQALDDDMRRRIDGHRASRPPEWRTIEEPIALSSAIARLDPPPRALLLDCLTLWVSNLLLAGDDDATLVDRLDAATDDLLLTVQTLGSHAILVTNEVGLGVVPPTELGRRYRDLLGRTNQRVAQAATDVYLVVAGIPVDLRASRFSLPDVPLTTSERRSG